MERETKTIPAVEVWQPVKGYEGLYEVSDLARVRSLDRELPCITHGLHTTRIRHGIILAQTLTKSGYLSVMFCINKKYKRMMLHQVVAQAFIPNPHNYKDINHKDECKTNNLPSNLEWCDCKYNIRYGTGIERRAQQQRKKVEQLTLDGQHVAYFDSFCAVARETGYCQSLINRVCKGKAKTAYGYQWRYV